MLRQHIPLAREYDSYGHMDPAIVEVYGYGAPPDPGASPIEYAPLGSPVLAAIGDSAKGCLRDAADAIFGNADAYRADVAELLELRSTSIGFALSDGRYARALDSWSSCMGDGGYPAKDFGDAIRKYRVPHEDGAPASQAEIAAALVDLECRQLTRVNDVFEAVAVEFQIQHAAEHQGAIQDFNGRVSAALGDK